MARKHSAATRKKISEALKKFYSSGGKRGQRSAERNAKRKVRTDTSIRRTAMQQQSLQLKQRINRLVKQSIGVKRTSGKYKQIHGQIKTLRAYRNNLMRRIKSLK